MSDKLRHFSVLAIFKARTIKQVNPDNAMCHHTKPRGLWVSDEADENSWSKWCEAESFGLGPIEHSVILSDGANVLRIGSVGELDDFGRRYGVCPDHEYFRDEPAIQWADVSRDYDGILITPYQWARRLSHGSSWYYGWDCASGCIWNSRAVASIEPVGTPHEMADKLDTWLSEQRA